MGTSGPAAPDAARLRKLIRTLRDELKQFLVFAAPEDFPRAWAAVREADQYVGKRARQRRAAARRGGGSWRVS